LHKLNEIIIIKDICQKYTGKLNVNLNINILIYQYQKLKNLMNLYYFKNYIYKYIKMTLQGELNIAVLIY